MDECSAYIGLDVHKDMFANVPHETSMPELRLEETQR